jgi:hypothetical protein
MLREWCGGIPSQQGAMRKPLETGESGETQLDLKGLAARKGSFSNQSAQPPFFTTSNLKHSFGSFLTVSWIE